MEHKEGVQIAKTPFPSSCVINHICQSKSFTTKETAVAFFETIFLGRASRTAYIRVYL